MTDQPTPQTETGRRNVEWLVGMGIGREAATQVICEVEAQARTEALDGRREPVLHVVLPEHLTDAEVSRILINVLREQRRLDRDR